MNAILMAMLPMLPMLLAAAPVKAPVGESGWVVHEEVRLPGGQDGWQKTEIAFGKIRRETSQSREVVVVDPASTAPIFRLNGKQWSGIDSATLDAGKTPGPFVDGIGVNGDALDIPAVPFKATGRTETIGLWTAKEFVSVVTTAPGNLQVRVWLADRPEGIPNDAMLAVLERAYARKGNAWEPYFRSLKAMGGFPVRTVYRFSMGGKASEVVMTVTAIEKTAVAKSAFQLPSGSTRIDETRLPEPEPVAPTQKEQTP